LFVQHLKLEARIVVDQGERLGALLRSFKPKGNYDLELQDNSRFAALAGAVPPGPRGALLAADILYVAVRNHGVLLLAERGIHLYAFTQIIAALRDEGLIPASAPASLARLRFLKCLYRAGESTGSGLVLASANQSLEAFKTYGFPASVRQVSAEAILSSAGPSESASPYLHLRDLERRLLALNSVAPSQTMDRHLLDLRRWITDPRAYAGLSRLRAPELRLRMAIQGKLANSA
jgi:hypothetical protein